MKIYNVFILIFVMFFVLPFSNKSDKNFSNKDNSFIEGTSKVISSLNDVIKNNREFFSTENGKNIYFDDFNSENYLFVNDEGDYEYTSDFDEEVTHSYERFCVIDIDSDGNPELLLESKTSNILLLHYENGVVYGFSFPLRGMSNIKIDITFEVSGGAGLVDIGKIAFFEEKVIFKEQCFFNELEKVYRIDGKNVSKDEAEKYLGEQEEKENVEWYVYNKANLDKYLK